MQFYFSFFGLRKTFVGSFYILGIDITRIISILEMIAIAMPYDAIQS